MTPTEQDEELREAIIGIVEAEYKMPNYIPAVERIEHIMQLITADRKRVALEARIDELQAKKRGFYMAAGLFGADISKVEELWDKCKQELEKL